MVIVEGVVQVVLGHFHQIHRLQMEQMGVEVAVEVIIKFKGEMVL